MAWYDYNVTQGFKWTDTHRTWHSGLDLGAPWNTPVTAALPGTVIFAQCKPWGGQVDVLVSWSSLTYVVTVLHLHSILVNQGQHVAAGQLLGYSGGDGRGPCPTQMPKYSNGPHIHFEMTLGSVGPYHGGPPYKISATSTTVNPLPLLDALRSGNGLAVAGALPGIAATAASIDPSYLLNTPIQLPDPTAIFGIPAATVDAINAIPGVDNLIYRLHEAETFPGWKSLDSVAPLDTSQQQSASIGTIIGAGVGAIAGGQAGANAGAGVGQTIGTLGANLNPGRLIYWIAGNAIGNMRAAFVRLLYLGIGGMLFLALVIALGSAQTQVTLDLAEDATKAAAPLLEGAALIA